VLDPKVAEELNELHEELRQIDTNEELDDWVKRFTSLPLTQSDGPATPRAVSACFDGQQPGDPGEVRMGPVIQNVSPEDVVKLWLDGPREYPLHVRLKGTDPKRMERLVDALVEAVPFRNHFPKSKGGASKRKSSSSDKKLKGTATVLARSVIDTKTGSTVVTAHSHQRDNARTLAGRLERLPPGAHDVQILDMCEGNLATQEEKSRFNEGLGELIGDASGGFQEVVAGLCRGRRMNMVYPGYTTPMFAAPYTDGEERANDFKAAGFPMQAGLHVEEHQFCSILQSGKKISVVLGFAASDRNAVRAATGAVTGTYCFLTIARVCDGCVLACVCVRVCVFMRVLVCVVVCLMCVGACVLVLFW
jgi:hypothetical protein